MVVSISETVQKRIKKYYKRNTQVTYPPNSLKMTLNKTTDRTRADFYLAVGRLVPYKRFDLLVETFNTNKKKLVIVGSGSEEKRLKDIANDNIQFAGTVNDKKLALYYESAKALVFLQEEDFGLVAVEAQTFGLPVIAFGKGGCGRNCTRGLDRDHFSQAN